MFAIRINSLFLSGNKSKYMPDTTYYWKMFGSFYWRGKCLYGSHKKFPHLKRLHDFKKKYFWSIYIRIFFLLKCISIVTWLKVALFIHFKIINRNFSVLSGRARKLPSNVNTWKAMVIQFNASESHQPITQCALIVDIKDSSYYCEIVMPIKFTRSAT